MVEFSDHCTAAYLSGLLSFAFVRLFCYQRYHSQCMELTFDSVTLVLVQRATPESSGHCRFASQQHCSSDNVQPDTTTICAWQSAEELVWHAFERVCEYMVTETQHKLRAGLPLLAAHRHHSQAALQLKMACKRTSRVEPATAPTMRGCQGRPATCCHCVEAGRAVFATKLPACANAVTFASTPLSARGRGAVCIRACRQQEAVACDQQELRRRALARGRRYAQAWISCRTLRKMSHCKRMQRRLVLACRQAAGDRRSWTPLCRKIDSS